MAHFHLAQINVARALAPLTDPRLRDFVANLDAVNAVAESAPGFVWRLKTEPTDDGAPVLIADESLLIVNMSVWESVEALRAYTFSGAHLEVFRRRREWFSALDKPSLALWWIPQGQFPTVSQGLARLRFLEIHGPSAKAFHFKALFPCPGANDAEVKAVT